MDLLKILIVILHILILTNSYELICKATKKERYLFIFLVIKYVSIKTTTKNKSSYFIKKESPVIEDMITAINV